MQLVVGQKYKVTVSHIVAAGVVVKMADESTQLIHLSNVSDQFVKSPADFVAPGECYEAECITGYNGKDQLSLKHLQLRPTHRDNTPDIPHEVERMKLVKQAPARDTNMYTPARFGTSRGFLRPTAPTLDDMIDASNRAYQDKVRRSNKDRRKKK